MLDWDLFHKEIKVSEGALLVSLLVQSSEINYILLSYKYKWSHGVGKLG